MGLSVLLAWSEAGIAATSPGESTANAAIAAATALAAPANLQAKAGDQQVRLTWGAVAGAASYQVCVAAQAIVKFADCTTYAQGVAKGATKTTVNLTGLTNGTKYYFRVLAKDGSGGKGPPSVQVVATPKPGSVITLPHLPEEFGSVLLGNAGALGGDLYGVTHGNGLYVAVGNHGAILTSPDGATWRARVSGTDAILRQVVYGNGRFVAVGHGVLGISGTVGVPGTILTSPDGIHWTVRASGLSTAPVDVTFANGQFVAVGSEGTSTNYTSHTILTSSDGVHWAVRDAGTNFPLHQVKFGRGVYVAVGDGGTIVTSADAITWTRQATVSGWLLNAVNLTSIACGPNRFVVGGDDASTFTSSDGIHWTTHRLWNTLWDGNRMSYYGNINTLTDLIYADGEFLALDPGRSPQDAGSVLTSTDGANWAPRFQASFVYRGGVQTQVSLRRIVYDHGRLVAVGINDIHNGNYGVVLTAPAVTMAAPVITATTSSAREGTIILIDGNHFDPIGPSNQVTMNGHPAAVLYSTETQLKVLVPAAASGPIQVTTAGGTVTAPARFTMLVPPTITRISPASGWHGDRVVITGSHFQPGVPDFAVTFGEGWRATIVSASATRIVVRVPDGVTTDGPIAVRNYNGVSGYEALSSRSFHLIPPPVITGFSPVAGAAGSSVTLTGNGFGANSVVTIGGATATVTSASTTQLVVTVPADAVDGLIRVTNPTTGASAVSATPFTVTINSGGGGGILPGLMGGGMVAGSTPLTLSGSVTLAAGTTGVMGYADGYGAAATFNYPADITSDGTHLYIADSFNFTIRKMVIATGQVTTLAGQVGVRGTTDGIGTAATFSSPTHLTTDGVNLYVIDGYTIRKVALATNEVTTIYLWGARDMPGKAITTDGTYLYVVRANPDIPMVIDIATSVEIGATGWTQPTAGDGGITTDGRSLYVVNRATCTIRRIDLATKVATTLAGYDGICGAADGTGTGATFNHSTAITTDGTHLYVRDQYNTKIRKVVIATGVVTTLATTATTPDTSSTAGGITTDGTSLFITDYLNNEVRKVQ